MTMKHILLATVATIALSSPAFAADKQSYESNTKIEKDSDGNYSEKTMISKTETDGSIKNWEKTLSTVVDGKGNVDKTLTTESTTDPKGLGNKHVIKITDKQQTKDGQVTTTHTKIVDGKNVEGTTDHYKTESKVRQDSEGNYAERDITVNTDANGTFTSFEKNATVDVDDNGDVAKSTTTKKITDPKGLLNKQTVKTSNTETTKDGMVTTSQDVTVNGKTTESKSETKEQ